MRGSERLWLAALALAVGFGCDGAGTVLAPQGDGIVVTVEPANPVVAPAATKDFQATVTDVPMGSSDGIHWSLTGAGCTGDACGTLVELGDREVRFTAPAVAPVPSTVLLRAISDMPAGNSGVAYVTVGTVPISVTVDPAVASVANCGSLSFTATVSADVAQAGVAWSVEGALCDAGPCGTLFPGTTASGIPVTYAGPCSTTLPIAASVTVRATSLSDPSRSAAATVSIAN